MLYACLQSQGDGMRVLANATYPSKQGNGIIYDSSESELSFFDLKDDMPLRVTGFYSVIGFKADCVFLSRDVIGGYPLYYSRTEFSSFLRMIGGDSKNSGEMGGEEKSGEKGANTVNRVNPGEVVKVHYDGEVEKLRYSFDEVFKPDPSPKDEGEVEALLEVVERKLREFSQGDCISFSGGVDSSLLAAMYDVPLISVTASEKEEEHVRNAAREIGRELHVFRFGEEEVREVIPEVLRAVEEPNPFHVSIGIPVYLSMLKAKELGFESIIFGQGADELFGGYKKYENYRGEELFWILKKDVEMLGVNNLERDVKISYRVGIRILTPYLQWDIIKAVMRIPGEYKVREVNGEIVRKYALRKIAEKYLPESIAYRQKKAVQYSTKTSALLDRIARKEGMSVREYLEKVYAGL